MSQESSSTLMGSSQVSTRPCFSNRWITARDTSAFFIKSANGSGPRVAVRTSRIFPSAAFAPASSLAGFHATIFCVRVLRRCTISRAARWPRRTNLSAAASPPGIRRTAAELIVLLFSSVPSNRRRKSSSALSTSVLSTLAVSPCKYARPASASQYSRSWRSSISGGSIARNVSPIGAR